MSPSTMAVVVRCGPNSAVRGAPRHDAAGWGVAPGGVADHGSWRLGNRLLGNHPDANAVETGFGGLVVRCVAPITIAVTGAVAEVTVDGTAQPMCAPVTVPAGSMLSIGDPIDGLRTYVAVRGGVVDPATRHMAQPLTAGAELVGGRAPLHHPPPADVAAPIVAGTSIVVGCTPGPRASWFTQAALLTLTTATYTVSSDSDRVGVRLLGPELERRVTTELPSEGMVRGSIQVPLDGRPVVLGADHPLTGGYPVIAVVDPLGCDLLAQARPGTTVQMRSGPAPWEPQRRTVGGSEK